MRARLRDHPDQPGQNTVCGKGNSFKHKAGKAASPGVSIAYKAWIKCLIPQHQLVAFNLWEVKDHAFIHMLVLFLEQNGHSRARRAFSKTTPDKIIEQCSSGHKLNQGKKQNVQEKTNSMWTRVKSTFWSSNTTNRSSPR